MKPASDLIYVRVLRNGYIPQLGICGPIPNPIQITRGKAYSMINDGIEVHEFDPKTKETVKLTVQNVFGDGTSAPAPEVKSEEKKAEPVKAEEKKVEPEKPVTLTGVAKPEEKKEEAPAPKAEEVKVEEKKAEPVEEVKADEKAETPEVKADNKKENATNNTGKKNK